MLIYLDGDFVSNKNEILEPGFLYGWGVFETIRVYKGIVVGLDEHLLRMRKGAEILSLEYPESVDFENITQALVDKNHLKEAYVRINLYKKRDGLGIIVVGEECDFYPEDMYKTGAKITWAPFVRYSKDTFNHIKTMSYAPNRAAWFKAKESGFDESVFLNEKENIQEGSRSNIFFVKNSKIYTPSKQCGVLGGITRKILFDICPKIGYEIVEGEYHKSDFIDSDEVFLTSSLMDVMPVGQIDNIKLNVSNYKITYEILKAYREHVS